MNTKLGWIIVGVVAVLIVIGVILVFSAPSASQENTPDNKWNGKSADGKEELIPKKSGISHKIVMKNNEFLPKEVAINIGDEVIFINEDIDNHWPASDLHPTHLLCPGFDSLRPMKQAETYSHVFEKAEICPMHDHIMPRMRGKIIIK